MPAGRNFARKYLGGYMNDLIAFLGMMLALAVTVSLLHSESCESKFDASGMEHRYEFMGGCQIKVDGVWIPSDNWRSTK